MKCYCDDKDWASSGDEGVEEDGRWKLIEER